MVVNYASISQVKPINGIRDALSHGTKTHSDGELVDGTHT